MKNNLLIVAIITIALIFTFAACTDQKSEVKNEEQTKLETKTQISQEDAKNQRVRKKPLSPTMATKGARAKRDRLNSLGYLAEADAVGSPSRRQEKEFNTEEYAKLPENEFFNSSETPLSTFSIDVDTASYSNIRRFVNYGRMPDVGAIRLEEMINYFDYDYKLPEGKHPFSVNTEVGSCPWNDKHKLVHIGIQGKKLADDEKVPQNLVFLLDVSGSMSSENKLPLLKKAFKLLVKELDDDDKVSIVVYAGAAGLVLKPTDGDETEEIMEALDKLQAGGSTAGGAGIQLAYKVAEENLFEDGNNRIILATDGDFNIGVSSTSSLVEMIEEKRKKGIYITILGFGMGNYKDHRMEQIADKGNGNYFYIDNLNEAKKVLVRDLTGTLFTIAKDVKIQVEFNPAKIESYRLIGYENRLLNKEDFNDDKKDAGELGAGHTVTALYEVVPVGVGKSSKKVDDLTFQQTKVKKSAYDTEDIMMVKLRYKPPKSDKSILLVERIKDADKDFDDTSENFQFSAAVAGAGMLMKDSKFKGSLTYNKIIELAEEAKGDDEFGYRSEFIEIIKAAKKLDKKQR